ncbi:MAG: hypothetical protein HDR02_07945 [Lachnospiraceae bacterium]|nr:hypothetical protein [Lachnospiraceae bacterium]
MEEIRRTVAPSRLFYLLLIAIWVMILALVTAVLFIMFPPSEYTLTESYVEEETHRPAEYWRYLRYQDKLEECQPYMATLAEGEYEAVFLAMYSLESFDKEDFQNYRGVAMLKIEPVPDNSLELLGVLEQLLSCDELPEQIYLGIDPIKMEQHLAWEEELDWQSTIAALIREHEEISWEVLLAYPSLAEWQLLAETEREQGIAGYRRAMETLTPLENLTLFYIGSQEWLVCNQDNYTEDSTLNVSVTHTMMLSVFCDQNYIVTEDNQEELLEELEETLDIWLQNPPYVKVRAGDTLVFLGDSIFGNYTDSTSVPGVAAYFTGANCINCGYGGICLATGDWNIAGIDVIANLCNGQTGDIPEGKAAYSGIQDFAQGGEVNGRLVFLINYGINDYLWGNPIELEDKYAVNSYTGAMRTGIEQLQMFFPDAEIVVLSPSYITYWDCGIQIVGENGGILKEYVEAAIEVAQEYGLPYMNIYEDLETCAETEDILLADGVHLNERGRFRLGMLICEKLDDIIQ